jgi:hypothetical protein
MSRIFSIAKAWLSRKYQATKDYIKSLVNYIKFVPDRNRIEELESELARVRSELNDVNNTLNEVLLNQLIREAQEQYEEEHEEEPIEEEEEQYYDVPEDFGDEDWIQLDEQYKNIIKSFKLNFVMSVAYDIDLEIMKYRIVRKLLDFWNERQQPFKFYILYGSNFIKPTSGEISEADYGSYYNLAIYNDSEIESKVNKAINNIINSMQNINIDSEWVWYESKFIILRLFTFSRGTYAGRGGEVSLPKWVQNKKCCVNIKNDDDKCFLWCVLRALHPVQHNKERINDLIQYQNELFTHMLNFPVQINNAVLNHFEVCNNLRLNIFYIGNKKGEVYSVYVSDRIDCQRVVDLGLIMIDNKAHYCYITDINRLLCDEDSKNKRYFCRRCLCSSPDEGKLKEHERVCVEFPAAKVVLRKDGALKFSDYDKLLWNHYVIYSDFECTFKDNKYSPVSFTVFCPLVGHIQYMSQPDPYVLMEKFWLELDNIRTKIMTVLNYPNKLYEKAVTKSDICWICQKKFDKCFKYYIGETARRNGYVVINGHQIPYDVFENPDKYSLPPDIVNKINQVKRIKNERLYEVEDYDDVTGEFRGTVHKQCRDKLKTNKLRIPVVFHNGSGFDFHLILRYLPINVIKVLSAKGVSSVIARTMEKYMSFTISNFVFIDSFSFLPTSIQKLGEILKKSNAYNYTHQYMPREHHNILDKKLHFPYEWLDSYDKLQEPCLPPIEAFYSHLRKKHISQAEYDETIETFKALGCTNVNMYLQIYNKMDVLILADAMTNYRRTVYNEFHIDPLNFISAPACAWKCALRKSNVELDYITDNDMLLMIERGIRGGMCGIGSKSHAVVKDAGKESIVYIDANNLYGYTMMQPLPVGGFKWLSNEELECVKRALETGNEAGVIPCLLEVDLEYPKHLFTLHNDYPLAPHKLEVSKGQVKLCQTFLDKNNYVVHYKNLIYYLQKGMRLKKIHRAFTFKESPFLKTYIETCIKLRQTSKTEMEKTVWKLMVNSVYGKTMENLRKRIKIAVVLDDDKKLERLIANPFFVTADVIITDKLVCVKHRLNRIKFDKPIYVGQAILDLSKLHMFKMHYDVVKPSVPESTMMYTDTDSLIYYSKVSFEDFIRTLKDYLDLSVCSDIAKSLGLDPNEHKMIPGYFKVESANEEKFEKIVEFYGRAPKMYEIISESGKHKVKSKGFKEGLIAKGEIRGPISEKLFYTIKSVKHELMMNQMKRSSKGITDKRVVTGECTSVPYGYV